MNVNFPPTYTYLTLEPAEISNQLPPPYFRILLLLDPPFFSQKVTPPSESVKRIPQFWMYNNYVPLWGILILLLRLIIEQISRTAVRYGNRSTYSYLSHISKSRFQAKDPVCKRFEIYDIFAIPIPKTCYGLADWFHKSWLFKGSVQSYTANGVTLNIRFRHFNN